ncbi:unnamed protein product, partial [Mycena citricolor]
SHQPPLPMPPTLKAGATLKQRLAALSLAQSSPSPGPSSPPSASAFKRKFTAPWTAKRQRPTEDYVAFSHTAGRDNVDDVLTRLIFQAGVDFETRPMVVLNASALPDPREVDYDVLLSRVLAYLNLYVESDYTVVFFAAGGRHTPGWNWVWKAYRSLSRKYRKNLKRLYIIHSSFFSKMLFSLAGAIISPKFFRKIAYIGTLSELAFHIPITQIDLSPSVYQENLKYESKITMPVTTRGDTHIFGVPLEDLMGFDGEKGGLPRPVKDCIQFIRETGLEEEGLFRRSPSSAMLRAAQEAYDRGHFVSLETFGDPHLAAVLVKKYLRDLPEPIFPESLYAVIRRCPAPSATLDTSDSVTIERDLAAVAYVRDSILPQLPLCTYILLSNVLHLMHDVSLRAASNRMDAHNLAVVLSPNLVKSKTNPIRDVWMCSVPGGPALFSPEASPSTDVFPEGKTTLGAIVKLCILRYFEVFDELPDRAEAQAPLAEAPSASSSASSSAYEYRPPSPRRQSVRSAHSQNDDEDLDDGMLVMPIGPGSPMAASPPSAWGSSSPNGHSNGQGTFRPRHRTTLSGGGSLGGTRSIMSGGGAFGSVRSRSLISVEKGSGPMGVGTVGKRGSIAIGRGTTKASGAAVEAVGITAEGFFAPPVSSP